MKFEVLPKGPFNGPLSDFLVPEFEFDFDNKTALLKSRERQESQRDRFADRARSETVVDESPAKTVAQSQPSDVPGHEQAARPDQSADPLFELPEADENAVSGLDTAAEHAGANASKYARLFQEWSEVDTTSDETTNFFESGGGAKPQWAKGGETTESGTTEGETTTTKGRGKNKDKSADEPVVDETTPEAPVVDETTPEEPVVDETTPEEPVVDETTPPGETNNGTNDPNTYVSGLDTPDGYNIEIVFDGAWTDALKQGLYNVTEKISDIITGDLAAHNGIDDVRISASLTSIDGAGGYWGWGGVDAVRSNLLASEGYIRFDEADAAAITGSGQWEDVAFHEILHALGFGVAWNAMGLVEDFGGDLRFTGANAIEAYNNVYSDIASSDPLSAFGVAVETDGGSATSGVHWDDATFGSEIMTGYIGGGSITSDMTVAALEDMGYETVYESGDMIA